MTSPLISSTGRIFIRVAGSDYEYYGNAKLAGISKSFGESAPIYGQDPERAGRFRIIDRVPSTEENFWTTTMTGYVNKSSSSKLALAANNRCMIDIQAHYGTCNDPTDFTDYESAIILEDCRITQYQTTDLVALEPKDTSPVQETVNISATTATRLVGNKVAASGLAGNITGVVTSLIHANPTCIIKCDPSGCGRLYALIADNGVSTIVLSVAWSDDNGITWYRTNLNNTNSETRDNAGYRSFQIQATKDYLVIFNFSALYGVGGANYCVLAVPHSSFLPTASSVNPIVVMPNSVQQIFSSFTAGGFVYFGGYTGGISKLSNQLVATTLYTFDGEANVTVGRGIDADNMLFFYTDEDGHPWSLVKSRGGPFVATDMRFIPAIDDKYGIGTDFDVYAAAMLSQDEWLIGISLGDILKTYDGGVTWQMVRSGAADPVVSIEMATSVIGYAITSSPAVVYQTIDGGESWVAVRENSSWQPTVAKNYACLSICSDPNLFYVGGCVNPTGDITAPYKASGGTATTVALGYGG